MENTFLRIDYCFTDIKNSLLSKDHQIEAYMNQKLQEQARKQINQESIEDGLDDDIVDAMDKVDKYNSFLKKQQVPSKALGIKKHMSHAPKMFGVPKKEFKVENQFVPETVVEERQFSEHKAPDRVLPLVHKNDVEQHHKQNRGQKTVAVVQNLFDKTKDNSPFEK